jgi:hypothetical protein
VSIIPAIFMAGGMWMTVKNTKEDVADLKATSKEHGKTLVNHGEHLSRLQEWKDGFSAGARLGKPE